MGIFYFTLISSYILSLIGRLNGKKLKNGYITTNKQLMFLSIFIIAIVSSLRSNLGDTRTYMYSYRRLVNGLSIPDSDKGFYYLQKLLIHISSNPQILIFVTGTATTFFMLYGLKKYSSLFELTIFLYITSGYYLVTMNGIRQTLTSSLFYFFVINFLMKRNFFKYSLSVILISFFHSSAIILIPLYFIFTEKNWSYKLFFLMFLSIFLVTFYDIFVGMGTSLAGEYGHYIENKMGYQGANPIRVLVDFVPVILCFLKRDKIKKTWNDGQYFINISFLNLLFSLLSTQNWIYARFSLYLSPANFIILPFLIKNYFKESDRKTIYVVCILFYTLYYLYENTVSLKIIYRSIPLGIY